MRHGALSSERQKTRLRKRTASMTVVRTSLQSARQVAEVGRSDKETGLVDIGRPITTDYNTEGRSRWQASPERRRDDERERERDEPRAKEEGPPDRGQPR